MLEWSVIAAPHQFRGPSNRPRSLGNRAQSLGFSKSLSSTRGLSRHCDLNVSLALRLTSYNFAKWSSPRPSYLGVGWCRKWWCQKWGYTTHMWPDGQADSGAERSRTRDGWWDVWSWDHLSVKLPSKNYQRTAKFPRFPDVISFQEYIGIFHQIEHLTFDQMISKSWFSVNCKVTTHLRDVIRTCSHKDATKNRISSIFYFLFFWNSTWFWTILHE